MQSHYTTTTTDKVGRAGRIRTVVGYRHQFCRLMPSTARPLHDHSGASPPNRTASSCSSDRRADHLRQRGLLAPRDGIEPPPRVLETPVLPLHQRGISYGGRAWSRTRNVYREGPDLQSGGAHAVAPRRPIDLQFSNGQRGWDRTSDLLTPSEARYPLRHTLMGPKHWQKRTR